MKELPSTNSERIFKKGLTAILKGVKTDGIINPFRSPMIAIIIHKSNHNFPFSILNSQLEKLFSYLWGVIYYPKSGIMIRSGFWLYIERIIVRVFAGIADYGKK